MAQNCAKAHKIFDSFLTLIESADLMLSDRRSNFLSFTS
ncbi:hypothetical protein CEV31_0501 [Brucella thiophenivorans]|uniref:Uncharacterized protein n=1 Tax=Brucella thiophenivorans TaxID=571255 RepID=A0A256G3K4_9HYPH|nr:hypothetical protein CEV31_0501 [Brucella thiophenivorans]